MECVVDLAILGRTRTDERERGRDLGVADSRQALSSRRSGSQRRQASRSLATVFLKVAADEGLQSCPVGEIEVAPRHEILGQGPGLVERPSFKGGHELWPCLTSPF